MKRKKSTYKAPFPNNPKLPYDSTFEDTCTCEICKLTLMDCECSFFVFTEEENKEK